MPHQKKSPMSAAKAILKLIEKGEAKTAREAIKQHPELKDGLSILESALAPEETNEKQTAAKPSTNAKPSGSRTLSRL